jgi:UDP-4-amino-4,6-dideoxy-N-acetyl-beta-L-altrosamine transaminase
LKDNFIPYGKQKVTSEDIASVVDILNSDFLTQGPAVTQFESALREVCHAKYTTVFSSATAALHIACKALDVGKGDIVWTSPNTFVASANCVLYCGAKIDFVDICPKTLNMSLEKLQEKLLKAKQDNTLPKVVIPVHFAGQSCDMKKIKQLSEQYGFFIIEDAAHAIGSQYLNHPVGDCQYSDICVFSFHPVKIITTGEGGAAMTNNAALDEKLKRYRTHGITRDSDLMVGESQGDWYYQQIDLGYNYRITDIQCALGISQLKRLGAYVKKRNEIVKRYHELLFTLPLTLPVVEDYAYSAYHLYVIQIDETKTSANRKDVFDYLKQNGIGVNVHYIPVHTQPFYKNLGFKEGDFVHAENYYHRAITLPLFPMLKDEEQDYIAQLLRDYKW